MLHSATLERRSVLVMLSPVSAIQSVLPSAESARSSVSLGPSPLYWTAFLTLHFLSRKNTRLRSSSSLLSLITT